MKLKSSAIAFGIICLLLVGIAEGKVYQEYIVNSSVSTNQNNLPGAITPSTISSPEESKVSSANTKKEMESQTPSTSQSSTSSPKDENSNTTPNTTPLGLQGNDSAQKITTTLKVNYRSAFNAHLTQDLIKPSTVISLMEILRGKGLNYQATDYGDLGVFINSLDNITPDSSHFWSLYINGKLSGVGASNAQANPGDTVEWRLESIN